MKDKKIERVEKNIDGKPFVVNVTIEVGGVTLVLTPERVRELRDALNRVLGDVSGTVTVSSPWIYRMWDNGATYTITSNNSN